MTQLGTVEEIWRYPVSSLGGEQLTSVEIGTDGIEGDRNWCVVDRITSQAAAPEREERWRPALFLHARLNGRATEIGFPDGQWLPVTMAEIGERLSDHFGFEATVMPYAKAKAANSSAIAVNRYEPSPLHLITTSSMEHLAGFVGIDTIESKRFRPTIVLRTSGTKEFREKTWLGRSLLLGHEFTTRASEETKRCGLTLISQPGVAENADILRAILRQNRRNFGIYGTVEQAGTVTVGGSAYLLDR
ncbi:MOSC domain-containing protein [Agrobacterium vaccinii]|uniref:MOSC domain-containing protein n=1 Tax=Agrobacterium vaccinii TaxID=2735528 RepID=UPI001E40B85C|nr:MOSC N-terminal beta barrel domain-containing protein [Agrobacterium vaccinii]